MHIRNIAETFVTKVPEGSIQEQLKWFKVSQIRFADYLSFSHAGAAIGRDVWITLPKKTTLQDKLLSVGHELGHLFQYFPEKESLRESCPFGPPRDGGKWGRFHGLNSHDEVELFCDAFGIVWLQRGENKRDLAKLLMSTLGDRTIRI